jgi:MscS family membrane protein
MLDDVPEVDRESARVRFVSLGAFSFDVEVFAYLFARDWNHFLMLQERMLFGVTEIVARAGTEIAFPSQRMYVDGGASSATGARDESRSFLQARGAD